MDVDGEEVETERRGPVSNERLAGGVPCAVSGIDAAGVVAVKRIIRLLLIALLKSPPTHLSLGLRKIPFTSVLSRGPPTGDPETRLILLGL